MPLSAVLHFQHPFCGLFSPLLWPEMATPKYVKSNLGPAADVWIKIRKQATHIPISSCLQCMRKVCTVEVIVESHPVVYRTETRVCHEFQQRVILTQSFKVHCFCYSLQYFTMAFNAEACYCTEIYKYTQQHAYNYENKFFTCT